MTAEEWMTFPGVIFIPKGEEPPEPTVPKDDAYGKPLFHIEDGVKYLIRDAYFSNNTYIQAIPLRSKGNKKPRQDVRKESEEAVRIAHEQVRREAEELRERHKKGLPQ